MMVALLLADFSDTIQADRRLPVPNSFNLKLFQNFSRTFPEPLESLKLRLSVSNCIRWRLYSKNAGVISARLMTAKEAF